MFALSAMVHWEMQNAQIAQAALDAVKRGQLGIQKDRYELLGVLAPDHDVCALEISRDFCNDLSYTTAYRRRQGNARTLIDPTDRYGPANLSLMAISDPFEIKEVDFEFIEECQHYDFQTAHTVLDFAKYDINADTFLSSFCPRITQKQSENLHKQLEEIFRPRQPNQPEEQAISDAPIALPEESKESGIEKCEDSKKAGFASATSVSNIGIWVSRSSRSPQFPRAPKPLPSSKPQNSKCKPQILTRQRKRSKQKWRYFSPEKPPDRSLENIKNMSKIKKICSKL